MSTGLTLSDGLQVVKKVAVIKEIVIKIESEGYYNLEIEGQTYFADTEIERKGYYRTEII